MTGREKFYWIPRAASLGVAFGAGLLMLSAGQGLPARFCWALIPLLFVFCEVVLKSRGAPKLAAWTPA